MIQRDNVIHPQYKGLDHNLKPHTKKNHYYLKIVNICYLIILKCMAEKFEKMKEKGEKGNGHFKLKSDVLQS